MPSLRWATPPTALLTSADLIETAGLRPALVIGVPVGFVNVVESKERLFSVCTAHGVRYCGYGAQGRQRCRFHLQRAGVFRRRDARPHRPGMEIIFLWFAFKVLCGAL